ncbi:PAS domain-containing protein [Nisaea sp.]|uniref:PAS domain-containing protein n=1 Tax=Nisaea sp. TaxID=2024842 RepID=UPI003263A1AD
MARGHAERIGQVGSWYWALEGDKIFWSDQSYHILGLDRAGPPPLWTTFLQIVHPDERDAVDRWFYIAWKADEESAIECRILRADGSVRWVEGRVGPLFENGSKTAVCGTLMDVTERAR